MRIFGKKRLTESSSGLTDEKEASRVVTSPAKVEFGFILGILDWNCGW